MQNQVDQRNQANNNNNNNNDNDNNNNGRPRSPHYREFIRFGQPNERQRRVQVVSIDPMSEPAKIPEMDLYAIGTRIAKKLNEPNVRDLDAMAKINYANINLQQEIQQLRNCIFDEKEFLRQKQSKQYSYANSCFKKAEQIMESEEVANCYRALQPLRPNLTQDCLVLCSKAIMNGDLTMHDFPSIPLFILSYLKRAEVYFCNRNWFKSLYDLNAAYIFDYPLTHMHCRMYIKCCLEIVRSYLRKLSRLSDTDVTRPRYIALALKYLDMAEVENLLSICPPNADREYLLIFQNRNKLKIRNLRAKCCVYQTGIFQPNEPMEPVIVEDDAPLPKVWSNVFENTNFDVNYTLSAKKHFKRGKTVFFERAFVALPELAFHFCGWCNKRIDLQFMPCLQCNEKVYCDVVCREMSARTPGHHDDTCLMEYKLASLLTIECYMVFQLLLRQENFERVVNHIARDGFDAQLSCETFAEMQLAAMLNGHQSITKFEESEMENLVISQAIQLGFWLTCIKQISDNLIPNVIKCFYYLLVSHYVSPFSGERLSVQPTDLSATSSNMIYKNIHGHGMFGYRLKHSCDPNLKRLYKPSGFIVYKAYKEIQKSEVLTINYGVGRNDRLDKRFDFLRKYYNFHLCKCQKCTVETTPENLNRPFAILKKVQNEISITLVKLKVSLDYITAIPDLTEDYIQTLRSKVNHKLSATKKTLRELQLSNLDKENPQIAQLVEKIQKDEDRLKFCNQTIHQYKQVSRYKEKISHLDRKKSDLLQQIQKQKEIAKEIAKNQQRQVTSVSSN